MKEVIVTVEILYMPVSFIHRQRNICSGLYNHINQHKTCGMGIGQIQQRLVTVEILYMPVSFIQPYELIELVARYKFDSNF